MSFYDDADLRVVFLEIARVAWEISRVLSATERVSFSEARRALGLGSEIVQKLGDLPADETRNWVRSEAEAALWWPFQSPSVSEGPYAQIDIGAGTTNLAIFRIVARAYNDHRLGQRKLGVFWRLLATGRYGCR